MRRTENRVLQTAVRRLGEGGSGLKNPANRVQGCNSVCDTDRKPIPEILSACPAMQTWTQHFDALHRTVRNGTTSGSWSPMLQQPRFKCKRTFQGGRTAGSSPEKPARGGQGTRQMRARFHRRAMKATGDSAQCTVCWKAWKAGTAMCFQGIEGRLNHDRFERLELPVQVLAVRIIHTGIRTNEIQPSIEILVNP